VTCVCPNCGRADGLWEGVMLSGYYELDEHLQRTSGAETDGAYTTPSGEYGCAECGWTGTRGDITKLGIDGKPLPPVHPQQTRIA